MNLSLKFVTNPNMIGNNRFNIECKPLSVHKGIKIGIIVAAISAGIGLASRVYLTNGGDVKNGLHLEKLKGSKGDQNYSLEGVDVDKYDTMVVYCQPLGVHFGQAKLAAT